MKIQTFPTVAITGNQLETWFDNQFNVMLIGLHGTGKTAQITQVFQKKCGTNWQYFSGSTLDPFTDLIGIPKPIQRDGNEVITYIRPEHMNDKLEAIFIDEYNRSHKKVRNAIMELIQFKRINGAVFPNLKVVWVACNPNDDEDSDSDSKPSYDVEEIDPAQMDRFHIKVNVSDAPSMLYFQQKYGKTIAENAIQWHKNLPKGLYVSSRALDYAVDAFIKYRTELKFMLPAESNPSQLEAKLKQTPLRAELEAANKKGHAISAIFLKGQNEAELIKAFETDTPFRNQYMLFYLNDFNKELLINTIRKMTCTNAFGIPFEVDTMDGVKKIFNGIRQPGHDKRDVYRFLLKNKEAFFSGAQLAEIVKYLTVVNIDEI